MVLGSTLSKIYILMLIPIQSEGWASSAADSFDPWGQVPEEPAAKPPKEKKPPRDKKPVVEKKPPREKRSGREQSSTPTAESAPTSETKPQAENVTLAETPTSPSVEASTSSAQGNPTDVDRKKNQAYNNPERVKTGGTQRVSNYTLRKHVHCAHIDCRIN